MSLPAFEGNIINKPWQNETVNPATNLDRPGPNGYPPGTLGSIKTYNPFNQPINWTSNVPSILQGLNINQIAQLGITYTFVIDFVYTVKGNQYAECGSIPNINMNIYQGIPSTSSFITTTNFASLNGSCTLCTQDYCSSGNCPKFTYSINITEGNFPTPQSFSIQINPWNDVCINHSVNNFTLEIVANIKLFVRCETGPELDSNFCRDFCSIKENQNTCYPQYRDYCLIGTSSPGIDNLNIYTNLNCDLFFSNFLSNIGPTAEIDLILTNSCTEKFPDVFSYDKGDGKSQKICACHLKQEIYDNLRNSLIEQFPGFQYVDENERCLFPTCPSSVYKTVDIGKTCALPQCIQLAAVTNNGTISGGTQITQNVDQCIAASNQTGGGSGGGGIVNETKTWIDKNWVWLVIGLGILVILIIVILIVVAAESNKKKVLPKKVIQNIDKSQI